jgi:anhydro-N-acetylmuramic acid kinase
MTVIGLISGTSYDAVDAAAARMWLAGGTLCLVPLGLHSVPVPAPLRARIAAALPPHRTTAGEICRLDTAIGQLFGSVAADANTALTGGRAELVASHGQTVYHWVEGRTALGTLQLGEPAWIAEASGLPVVSGLRSRDITRGGQGAPLASLLDALLVLGDDRSAGSLNLGGIANITVRSGTGDIVAYDIGPAGALMDRAVADATGGREHMDVDGARAARGRVNADLLTVLLTEPYYRLPPPKSTGKELFHAGYLRDMVGERDVPLDDLLATLAELTAILVARSCREHGVQRLFVAGGGIRNPALMGRVRALAAPARVSDFDELGMSAQSKEAYLMAVIGFLTAHGLPATIPSATGAATGSILGSVTPGAGPLRLPAPARSVPSRITIVPASACG